MDYDPSQIALLHPEQRAPLFAAGQQWPIEALCAELSRLAYFRFEEDAAAKTSLLNALAAAGLTDTTFFASEATNTHGFAVRSGDGKQAFMVFRGTQADHTIDLKKDFNFPLVSWDGPGKVHTGFQQAFASVRADVQAWAAACGAQEICICGHSLGAALATLAAALIPSARLITFGSPRVGDQQFADVFRQRQVTRFVDCCDGVTTVPPEFTGYVHLQGLRYIDRDGAIKNDPSLLDMTVDQAAAQLAYATLALKPGNVLLRVLADHAPINYVRAQAIPGQPA